MRSTPSTQGLWPWRWHAYFSKLLAYKDEYEVARLHADPLFTAKLNEQFEGDFQLRFHLAPPLFAKRDQQGRLLKAEYGPWMMKAFSLLQHLKFLRGTAFDVFGRSDERRKERAWIERYEAESSVRTSKARGFIR
jgi:indolepyruvate ferredoxin oxidoreductase